MKPSEILSKAADLIEPEGRWTQGASAHAGDGLATGACQDDAICWCLGGAIERTGYGHFSAVGDALKYFTATTGGALVSFNDAPGRTQAEVVAKLREAAALAESEGR